jgi:hypothetical protein
MDKFESVARPLRRIMEKNAYENLTPRLKYAEEEFDEDDGDTGE